ncbi:hypothetical protein Plhal304r1_c011g0042281 [Plasmopara halstedii]
MRGAFYVVTALFIASSARTATESIQIKLPNVRKNEIGGMDPKTSPKRSLTGIDGRVVHATTDEFRSTLADIIDKPSNDIVKLILPELSNDEMAKIGKSGLSKMIMDNLGSPADFKVKADELLAKIQEYREDLTIAKIEYNQLTDAAHKLQPDVLKEGGRFINQAKHHNSLTATDSDPIQVKKPRLSQNHHPQVAHAKNKAEAPYSRAEWLDVFASKASTSLTLPNDQSSELKRKIIKLEAFLGNLPDNVILNPEKSQFDSSSSPSIKRSGPLSHAVRRAHCAIKDAVSKAPPQSAVKLLDGLSIRQTNTIVLRFSARHRKARVA